jgi:hypothetical protein
MVVRMPEWADLIESALQARLSGGKSGLQGTQVPLAASAFLQVMTAEIANLGLKS